MVLLFQVASSGQVILGALSENSPREALKLNLYVFKSSFIFLKLNYKIGLEVVSNR